jgi:hypothetical protein
MWEEEEGAGWAKKAEWASCFRGRKKNEKWVGLLWMLGRIPKKNRKNYFFNFWQLKWVNSNG